MLTDEDRTLLERWKSIYPQLSQNDTVFSYPQLSQPSVSSSFQGDRVVSCRQSSEPPYRLSSNSTCNHALSAAEQRDGKVINHCSPQAQAEINCIFVSNHVRPSVQQHDNVSFIEGNNISNVTTSLLPSSSSVSGFHGGSYLLPVDVQCQSSSFTAALLAASEENSSTQFAAQGSSSVGLWTHRWSMGSQVEGCGSVGQGHGHVPVGMLQGQAQGPGLAGVTQGCGSVSQGRGQGRGLMVAMQGQAGRMQGQVQRHGSVGVQVRGRGSVGQGQSEVKVMSLPTYGEPLQTVTLLPSTFSDSSNNNSVDPGNPIAVKGQTAVSAKFLPETDAATGWISQSDQRQQTTETSPLGELT